MEFQSPRSGKFESNTADISALTAARQTGFNPLDRGNLNQIDSNIIFGVQDKTVFQSPRSGKFESNTL